jgi:uncharacterized protein (TIGR02246 family)
MSQGSTSAGSGSSARIRVRVPRRVGRSIAYVLALAGLALPLHARAEPAAACAKANQDVIARQFDRWNRAVATGKPDAVARLYAEDAVLQAAPSDPPLIGRAAIQAYFAEYLDRHAQGTLSMRSITISCNAASDTGTYAYRLTGKRKGTRAVFTGRYSTFYQYHDGDWLIVRQHHQPAPPTTIGIASR